MKARHVTLTALAAVAVLIAALVLSVQPRAVAGSTAGQSSWAATLTCTADASGYCVVDQPAGVVPDAVAVTPETPGMASVDRKTATSFRVRFYRAVSSTGTATALPGTHTFDAIVYWTPSSPTPSPTTPSPIATTTAPVVTGCWSAPSVCGYPDVTNTGVPAGHALTQVNGNVTISTAGTVYSDREVFGCINVTAENVTIRYVKVHCNDIEGISHWDKGVKETVPLKILDSEIDCGGEVAGVGITAIGDTNIDAERLNVHGCENGFDLDQWDTVKDSYIWDGTGEGGHNDGIQLAYALDGCPTMTCAVTHSRDVTVVHNTIQAMNASGANGTSALISEHSGDENLTVDDNLLDGGAYTLYCDYEGQAVNSSYSHNRFGRSAAYGQATGCSDENAVGNVYDDNNQPIPLD